MSMLAIGTVTPLRTFRMLWNGSRTSPLKLKPKMASTTSSYSSSIIMDCDGTGKGKDIRANSCTENLNWEGLSSVSRNHSEVQTQLYLFHRASHGLE
jgi:hypothetical protein